MADNFSFLNFIEDGSDPAPKDTPKDTQDSDSDAENAERKDFWDHVPTDDHGAGGSPNSNFNSSPTHPPHHDVPTPAEGPAKQGGGKPALQMLKDARTYGFRKNVERRVFKGSGAMDHDESGNYDPNEEAAANRRLAKKKAAPKSGLAEVEIAQHDSQGEEILPSIEEDVSDEESSVETKRGKGSKKNTTAAAGRKKGKGKVKVPAIPGACAACQTFGLECSILDDPEQFPCTTCSEEGMSCVLENPKTPEAKAEKKLAESNIRNKKKEKARIEREQKKNSRKKNVQLAVQNAAPKINPKNRKYISCAPCRAGGFHSCSLKTKENIGPCRRCISSKVACTFEDKVIKTGKAGTKNGKGVKAAGKASAKGRSKLFAGSVPRPRSAPKKDNTPKGMFKKIIKTRFCHPVTFDVNVNTTSTLFMGMNSFAQQTPCHFHTTTAFPMLGLGEPVEIEVYAPKEPSPANPFVYKECIDRLAVDNGEEDYDEEDDDEEEEEEEEREEGEDSEEGEQEEQITGNKKTEQIVYEDPTFVCTSCTFERQRILFCDTHRIRAIAGIKHPNDFDYNAAISKIWRDQTHGIGSNAAKDILWCSVCVAPAFYECCSPDRFAGEVGCGLMLCEVCAQGLCGGEGKLKGLLDEMAEGQAHNQFMALQNRRSVFQQLTLDLLIDRAGRDMIRYEDGIRADAGFLTNRGELKLWMESQAVADPNEYEEPEMRMDEGIAAGAAVDAGWAGWGVGMGLNGGPDETFEEYNLRVKLEKGRAEQANPVFTSVAPSVSADTDDWAL
ncbi:hypothetical protein VF21_06102 [Pseudogymnoascus sp. 05NY08]|nr:hypothetical protein VF21_06102 [Pseudogymnoascus sp. 05NY08]